MAEEAGVLHLNDKTSLSLMTENREKADKYLNFLRVTIARCPFPTAPQSMHLSSYRKQNMSIPVNLDIPT